MNPKLFTMIAWDPPGYGKSRPPTKDFNNFYRTDATMASKLMKALNYSRYSVMGWSNGGVCSLILTANEGANCVDKLIVWGTNAYVNEVDRACVSKVRDPTTSWSESFRKTFIDIYGEEELYQLWTRWVDHYISMDDLCKKDLVNIKCPVLLMHGDCDPMMSSDHPLYLTKHISNITLHRFPKGKHNIHQKYVDQFNKLCEDFLTSN
ncbi:hypothetical protein RDWZM_003262 [Blomia tropicalis]|uniref:Serine aminopeptidase S33 domain-containing protein n=1 Tax=Blomia tropicalis TaxID=40697 RepID=A0A9Q0MHR4_BLOTA|nr:hypothetical protein RDWZM_003262 [Blomia tropicalis]